MSHMRALCKDIGPRPPTSPQERQAADYVKHVLMDLGYADTHEYSFKSQDSYIWIMLPITLMATLGMMLDTPGKRWGDLIGSALCLSSAYTLRDFTRARFPWFQYAIARHQSQNLSVTIPARQSPIREVFLISHVDTQRQRYLSPPPWPGLMKSILTSGMLLAALGGLSRLWNALIKYPKRHGWHNLLAGFFGITALGVLLDELQPQIEGASDNASSVAVLLGLASALRASPLRRTQVTLLFTGCEEPVCVGIESYLRAQRPPQANTYWLDLDMVGGENICYATRHGISYLTEYIPDATLYHIAEKTASQHPELGVTGKAMLTLDEVSNLRDHGYAALLISSFGANGWLSHWHRVSDRLENITPPQPGAGGTLYLGFVAKSGCDRLMLRRCPLSGGVSYLPW